MTRAGAGLSSLLGSLVGLVASAFLLACAPMATRAPARDPLAGLDAYVDKALGEWGAPGAALAVVKDGRVVLARGHGVRERGKPERVDESTLFAIASLTKGFTAAGLGILIDEGKLAWDDPVSRHLPTFAVADPYVTKEITLRDLLAHRSGLAERADILWFSTGFGRDEILRRLAYLEQGSAFRSSFSYQNVAYLAAGELLGQRAGASWDDFIRRRLFEPLGMTRSNTSVRALEQDDNVARPHSDEADVHRPIPYRNVDNIGPAASINSSAADMARWLLFQLGQGSLAGRRILSDKAFAEMLAPQMLIGLDDGLKQLYPESHFQAYGLGWVLQDYRGRQVVWNTGGMDGMACSLAFLPEEKVGVVVLVNAPRISLPEALVFRVLDRYLGAPDKDWSGIRRTRSRALRQRAAAATQAKADARAKDRAPSLPLGRYAGVYDQPLMGPAAIALQGGRLAVHLASSLDGDLEPWEGDTFRIVWRDKPLGTSLCGFEVDGRGDVTGIKVEDYGAFQRRPASASR